MELTGCDRVLGEITKVEVEVAVPEAGIALTVLGLQASMTGDEDRSGGILYLSLQDAKKLREQLDEVIAALELHGRQP